MTVKYWLLAITAIGVLPCVLVAAWAIYAKWDETFQSRLSDKDGDYFAISQHSLERDDGDRRVVWAIEFYAPWVAVAVIALAGLLITSVYFMVPRLKIESIIYR